jgi:thioredoxin
MNHSHHVIPTTIDTFETVVLDSDAPVVVDFWASWCGPCVRLAPIYGELAEQLRHIRFVSIDVDAEPELAQQFGITSIPTLMFLRDGAVVASHTGGLTAPELRDKLEAFAPAPEAPVTHV